MPELCFLPKSQGEILPETDKFLLENDVKTISRLTEQLRNEKWLYLWSEKRRSQQLLLLQKKMRKWLIRQQQLKGR